MVVGNLVHLLDKSIDVLFSVTKVTTLNVVLEFSGSEATSWVAELEWPQEVGSLLEVWTDSVDLVDQVFHANHAELAQVVLDELVVCQGGSLLVDLSISSLVDELSDALEIWVAVGNVWVDDCQHLLRSLCQTNEDTIVDLEESEKLQNLSWLWCNLVDTLDSDNEDKFRLLIDVEAARLSGYSCESDLLSLLVTVFLDI